MNSTHIVRPIITEKTLMLANKGWYTFEVTKESNKNTIASDVARFYKVKVEEVRMMVMHGKIRRVGRRMNIVARQNWKKAYVRLSKGQKIEAFDIQAPEAGA